MSIKKILYVVLGCISLVVGAVGAVVPMLPSFPFLLLAAFFFARSSEKLHTWFINTSLYEKNLKSYVEGRGMTRGSKVRIISTITLVMGFGFVVMMFKGLYIPCAVLGFVWICHIIYFVFGVKNIDETENI